MSLGPLQLAGLTLHLEVLVALGPTEAELSGIVADECNSLTRECRAGTEVTGFNTTEESNSQRQQMNINDQNLPHGCKVVLVLVFESQETFSEAGPEWWSRPR